jgi:hypothetical protein
MTTAIDDIVRVTINRESSAVSRAGFGTALLVSVHTRFAERLRIYSGGDILGDMVTDGFETTDVAYLQAAKALAQSPRPSAVAIGRAVTPTARVVDFLIVAANAFTYRITINGVDSTFLSDSDATQAEIQAGLVAAVNASTQAAYVTATPQAGDTVRVTADIAGNQFTHAQSANLTPTVSTAGNGPVEDMDAIEAENAEDWYGFAFDTRADEAIFDLATWTEARSRIFSAQTENPDDLAGTGGILERLQLAAFRRTFTWWHDPATEDYLDVAILARGLTADLDVVGGQITWANKELAGITPDVLTGGERTAIHGFNGNTYERRGGKNITRNGVMAQGEFIDVMTTIDWGDARLTEDIFAALTGTPTKIPFTQPGIDVIEAVTRKRSQIGVENGHFSRYEISIPTIEEVDDSDLEARLLRNVRARWFIAGAIHTVHAEVGVSV